MQINARRHAPLLLPHKEIEPISKGARRDPSTNVGSIGVISQHVDRSAALGAAGYKVTELVSGPYKGAGSRDKHLEVTLLAVRLTDWEQVLSIHI